MKSSTKYISIIVLIWLSFFLIYFSVNAGILTSTETSTQKEMDLSENPVLADITTDFNTFNFLEYFSDRQNELAQLNRDYLTIALVIIFGFISFLGVLMYFFNIRPSQQEIKEQKKEIKLIEDKLGKKILRSVSEQETNFKELENTIRTIQADSSENIERLTSDLKETKKALEKTIQQKLGAEIEKTRVETKKLEREIKNQLQNLEMYIEWSDHYIWETKRIYINVLRSLMGYLELGVNYEKTYLFELVLKKIKETLPQIRAEAYKLREHQRLMNILGKIKNHKEIKAEITQEAEKKLNG